MDLEEFDTRLAAYAVIVDDARRILLALWNGPAVPEWTMPGGGAELDETPEQTVVREVLEETGYHIELDGLLGTDCAVVPAGRRFRDESRPLKGVRMVYRAHVVGGELTNEVDGSTDEARWIPLTEVPGLRRVSLVDTAIGLWRASCIAAPPLLVVLAGKPGTGKTTLGRRLASELHAGYVRVDAVETVLLRSGVADPGVTGYAAAHEIAAGTLAAGTSVVVDAVNPVAEARARWRGLAKDAGVELIAFETVVPDEARHAARVEARRPDLAGQRVPTWQEVLAAGYQPWDVPRDGERTVIDMTDTGAGVAAALRRLAGTRVPRSR